MGCDGEYVRAADAGGFHQSGHAALEIKLF
jgi:hypothetical protein